MTNLEHLAHLLEDPQAILEDLEAAGDQMHSPDPGGSGPGSLAVGVEDAPPQVPSANRLAGQRKMIKKFRDASAAKRDAMRDTNNLAISSIIFEHFRPGPAFRNGHALLSAALTQRVMPGGPPWTDIVAGKPLGTWAKQAVRLDNTAGNHRGSGTIMADGRILTARHIVESPGFVFGLPPSPAASAAASFNRVVSGADVHLTVSGFTLPPAMDYAWLHAPTLWPVGLAGTAFEGLIALPLQTTPLAKNDLAGRKVAVIGHPAPPGPADQALAVQVYNDAPMSLKRIMPGLLHPADPLIEANGLTFLRHDCSTVGGASGSCLIDLETGVILGIHVSGKSPDGTEDRNRAVPAWLIDSHAIPSIPA